MKNLMLSHDPTEEFHLLCLGAHCDDIEIGAGGTILRLAEMFPRLVVRWVVFTGLEPRITEARNAATQLLYNASRKDLAFLGYRESYLPDIWAEVKGEMERLKAFNPDLILTHHMDDRHQDHRVIAELTWNTFRNHLIWEYEIPKFEMEKIMPNVFMPLTRAQAEHKISTIVSSFKSQQDHHWFDEATFVSMLRLRGIHSASPTRLAEAFTARKILL